MANRITLNETSYFGEGAIQEIVNEIKNRGLKKVMVATDPDLIKFKVAANVTDLFDAAGIDYAVYDHNQTESDYPERTGRRSIL